MPRCFLAILLPDDAKDRLVAIQPAAAPGMRIIGRQELHLTLHFLGDVAPECQQRPRSRPLWRPGCPWATTQWQNSFAANSPQH